MHRRNNEPAAVGGPVINRNQYPGDGISAFVTIPKPADIQSACEAFAVLVTTPAGKYRRRVYLSLHSATAAVQRAQAKQQPVKLVLCRLVPVAADLDINGEVT